MKIQMLISRRSEKWKKIILTCVLERIKLLLLMAQIFMNNNSKINNYDYMCTLDILMRLLI